MPMDPRTFVSIQPIPSPPHVGLVVTARSSKPVYSCEYPSRSQVSKENYERREYQKGHCGYRAVSWKPYKSVGEVILDDKDLILRSLGQAKEKSQDSGIENETKSFGKKGKGDISLQIGSSTEDSTANPDIEDEDDSFQESMLQSVNSQLMKGRKRINKVKLGVGLYALIKEEQKEKEVQKKRDERKQLEKKNCMKIIAMQDSSDDDSDDDLSKYMVALQDRELGQVCSNASDDNVALRRSRSPSISSIADDLIRSPSQRRKSSVKSFINISRWQRAGSSVTFNRRSCGTRIKSAEDALDEGDRGYAVSSPVIDTIDLNNFQEQRPIPKAEKSSLNRPVSKKTQTVQRENAKLIKKFQPRPFSPIHTNINFYETSSNPLNSPWLVDGPDIVRVENNLKRMKEHTFRQLCAVLWILEAMSQDQQPPIMPTISAWWSLKDLREDSKTNKRKAEREKAVDPMWKSFLNNPNRFSRGKSGRRSGLYQRRVSVAPTALLKLSSARSNSSVSNTTQVSRGVCRIDSAGHQSDSEPERNEETREEKDTEKARTGGRRVSISFQVPDEEDKNASPSNTSHRKAYSGFKGKAFVVKDVLVAKLEGRPKLNRSQKSSGEQQGRRPSTASEQSFKDDQSLKKRGLKEDSMNWKSKFAAAAIVSFGAISTNSRADKIPTEQKRKFQDLKKEQALVVHDNLEILERTRLQSVERKFCSLQVVTDAFKAISTMRTMGKVEQETDEEKKARYSVECIWYKNLLEGLPDFILEDQDCAMVLDKIAHYGSLEGRKISPTQFTRALSLLRAWELCDPHVSAAIETKDQEDYATSYRKFFNTCLHISFFVPKLQKCKVLKYGSLRGHFVYVRDKVVEMDHGKFEEWIASKVNRYKRTASAPI